MKKNTKLLISSSLMLFFALVSVSSHAQFNVEPATGEGAESVLGIEPGGDPIMKVTSLLSVGCQEGETLFGVKFINTPASAFVHTVFVAGGQTYMNQNWPLGAYDALDTLWSLYFYDNAGSVDGSWPVPNNTEMDITLEITDGENGPVLYTREVTISQCNGGEVTTNQVVGEVSQPTRATFVVGKFFEDGNPSSVEVSIDCNTGLILDQDKTIEPGVPIEFVVTSFTNETLNCSITETPVQGYSASYQTAQSTYSDVACEFTLVEDREQGLCQIGNYPNPADINVTKLWNVVGDNNDVNFGYKLNLECDGGDIVSSDYLVGEGPDLGEHLFRVIPEYPSTSCSVYERYLDDAIEVENGCGNLEISAGGEVSCTITNTVFFEGVPSLNQYGLAVLALLMLGVGFVGFRRFT